MRRRLILVGVLVVTLAACGSSSGSPSASAADTASAAPSGEPAGSASPGASPSGSAEASAALPAAGSTITASCDGVTLRKAPSSSAARVKVINSGTAVHVAATVTGTPYTAGTCGKAGTTWLKIDKVAGKSVKATYGVSFVYGAAGFFE
jgi:hypothetical protein